MNNLLNYVGPETAFHMKAAGVRLKANYYWKKLGTRNDLIPQSKTQIGIPSIPAYSIGELGEMIPWGFFQALLCQKMPNGVWQVELSDQKLHSYYSEVEARAAYLIDLLESKQLDPDEINHPEKHSAILPSGKVAPIKAIKKKSKP